MYLEFHLPKEEGSQSCWHAISWINEELEIWANKYDKTFKTKMVKYTLRVIFPDEVDYTYFMLTWDPICSYKWLHYVVKDPMKPIDRKY